MVTTVTFWIVLAASAVIYWLLPRGRTVFLAAVSIGYLLTLDARSVIGLAVWTAAFYLLVPWVRPRAGGDRRGRLVLTGLVLAVLAYLAGFKYLPQVLAHLASSRGEADLLIPLGISYFTFKLIHYAIESARGHIARHSPQDFVLYLFLFPIFPAGPIERFDHFLASREDRWRLDSTVAGLTRIVHGLVKKFFFAEIVADYFIRHVTVADLLENLHLLSPLTVWWRLGWAFFYAWMDFSAYADLAIGSSRLFGLRIMENFNWPVLAPNIGNFWKRWHMTLSGWCMNYVYLPIMGLTRRPYLAVYATMLAIGLWHAGTGGWLCWGLYHATGLAVFVTWARIKRARRWFWIDRPVFRPAGIALTLLFVTGSFAFIVTDRTGGPWAGLRLLAKLVGLDLP